MLLLFPVLKKGNTTFWEDYCVFVCGLVVSSRANILCWYVGLLCLLEQIYSVGMWACYVF